MEQRQQTSREIHRSVRSYDNVIPRLRDRRSNPIARRYVSGPTLVTPDPEALLETARTYSESPQNGAKLYPWLKSRAALAADANVRQVRDEMYARMEEDNERLLLKLVPLEARLAADEDRVGSVAAEALTLAAELGLAREPGQRILPFLDHEPDSLEELAGELSVPVPELRQGWWAKTGYKFVCAIGGGGFFGLSLGLLSSKIELVDLSEEWPIVAMFVLFGIMLVAIMGGVIIPITKSLGDSFYRMSIRLPNFKLLALGLKVLLFGGFVLAVTVIESKVEQLGLLKLVTEAATLQGVEISKVELLWVSLMLVVPVVGLYIVSGTCEGERLSNLAYLRSQLGKRRKAILEHPKFPQAAHKLVELRSAVDSRDESKAEIERLRGQLRFNLTLEERHRLEDLQMDLIRYSQEAEDVMLAASSKEGSWIWVLWSRPLWRLIRRKST